VSVTATSLGLRTGPRSSRRRFLRRRSKTTAVPVICPYLIAGDGTWRSARPSREHHCGAVAPSAPLALDKQRRLCLVQAHATCATHLAALATFAGTPADPSTAPPEGARTPVPGGATRWSLVRTVPVVLDQPGGGSPRGPGHRRAGQWALGGLMALALGAVVLARLPEATPTASSSPAVLGATGQPAAAGVSSATARPRAAVSTAAAPWVGATTSPSASPRPSPDSTRAPSATRTATHVVAAGDTLIALARAYGTTVEALQAKNGLGDSTTLRIGQELRLP
jgi:LysM repeat protein